MNFIKLNDGSTSPAFVNFDKVDIFFGDGKWTKIVFGIDTEFQANSLFVKETPEEIYAMLKEGKQP